MTEEKPKKKRGRKKKDPVTPSVDAVEVKTVERPVPQLKKKILPHELIQTLESVLTRLDNLESQVKSLKK